MSDLQAPKPRSNRRVKKSDNPPAPLARPRTRAWVKQEEQLQEVQINLSRTPAAISQAERKTQQASKAATTSENERGRKTQKKVEEDLAVTEAKDFRQESLGRRDQNPLIVPTDAHQPSKVRSRSRQSIVPDWLSGLQPISPDSQLPFATNATPLTSFQLQSRYDMESSSSASKDSTVTTENVSTLKGGGPQKDRALSWDKLRLRGVMDTPTDDAKFEEIRRHIAAEPLRPKFKDTTELQEILQEFLRECENSRPNKDCYTAIEDLSNKINRWKPAHRLASITNQDFDIDIAHCKSSNEAVLQRTVMISVIDRWQLRDLFTFNCEGQWKLNPAYLLPTTGLTRNVTLPKPDLAIFFKLSALTGADARAPVPDEISQCLRPDGDNKRCFPFFFIEVKKAASDLRSAFRANIYSAGQALYNMFIWMSQARQEEAFFSHVRVFTMDLNAQEINLRMHRAIRDEDNRLGFHYVDIASLSGYSKDQACHLVRNILVEYAEKELHEILQRAFLEVSKQVQILVRAQEIEQQGKRKADASANQASKRSRSRQGSAVPTLPDQAPSTSSFGAGGLSLTGGP